MGIFDKFKNNSTPAEEPLSSVIEKTPSELAVVARTGNLPETPDELSAKLLAVPFIKVISKNERDSGETEFIVEYKDEEYTLALFVDRFELPELFRVEHDFTEAEIAAMESADRALFSRMIFGGNVLRSYHLQIKLMCALVEDPAGIADISGERIHSGRWARLAAGSDVPPAPTYLYCIQAVNDSKNNNVWLHTHGLNRCGNIELEILNLDTKNFNSYGSVINTIAVNAITKEPIPDEYQPQFCIRLPGGMPVVTTWVRWQTALTKLPRNILGGKEDRVNGHDKDTGVLFVYLTPEDCEKHRLAQITRYDRELEDNPMMMISSEETERMRSLAVERLGYLKELFDRRGEFGRFAALVKIGLEVDEQYRESGMKEHIWFEVKEFHEDGSFSAELTQETFYVEAMKPGDIKHCTAEELTDWAVYFDNDMISPDSVYRLEQ
ncbi:MAG: DUF4026 domain-containing protein [Oscillospiraceae bacterium]